MSCRRPNARWPGEPIRSAPATSCPTPPTAPGTRHGAGCGMRAASWPAAAAERGRSWRPPRRLFLWQEVGLDGALDLHRHRVAASVARAADLDPDPAFADRIFLDVVTLLPVEADAHATVQQGGIVEGAARIHGEAVGRRIGHGAETSRACRSRRRGAGRIPRGAYHAPPAAPPCRRNRRQPMALKATVVRVDLQISDMDRHYYASHSLTLA